MTDQSDKPKLGTRPPLGLKRTVQTGKVKQSFSHGRSNTVVVEVKKRRILAKPGEAPAAVEAPEATPVVEAPAPAPAAPVAATPAPAAPAQPAARATAPQRRAPFDDIMSRSEIQERLLREAEEARMTSLEEARRREDRAKVEQGVDEKRRAEENRKAEEEAAKRAAADAADAERAAADAELAPTTAATPAAGRDDERRFTRPAAPSAPKRPEPARPGRGRDDHRKSGKLTVTRALTGEDDSRTRSLAALRRAREKEKRAHASSGPSA
jgi:translation initiation factor IF-2